MAKFRRVKRYARSAFTAARKSYRKAGKNGASPLMVAGASALYGVGRPYVAPRIQQAAASVPQLGIVAPYADNIVLGLVGFGLTRLGNKVAKSAGTAMLANETFVATTKATSSLTMQAASSSSGLILN